jgi:lambda family phage minor tail protein L
MIQSEIQSLSPSAIVELFELDYSNYTSGTIVRFHAGTNQLNSPVVWKGVEYIPMPIEATEFEMSTSGSLPRPKMRVANVDGIISATIMTFDDLVGAKVTRKRTMVKFLDAVNFQGGVNPTADPSQAFQDDIWYVERKVSETRYMVEWELSSAFDLMGVKLPYRQVIQNSCTWRYRGAECGWTGANFDKNDASCDPSADECAKRLSSCRARFGQTAILPYGGFPGASRYG